ncbi:MAG: hypothetical protein Q9217_006841 [Psora testacea]
MSPSINLPNGVQHDGVQHDGVQHDGIPEEAKSSSPSNKLQDQFNIAGKVYLVTGGGRGLGLAMAEGLVEAGGIVYCLDQLEFPHPDFLGVQKATKALSTLGHPNSGSIHYRRVDVRNVESLNAIIQSIATKHSRIDGLIAAAAIQQVTPALEYTASDVGKMVDVNFTGAFMTAAAVARQMMEFRCAGSIVFVASMSGFVANKGLLSPVYNSTKAALIQLTRNLAMEWSRSGIRVNALCPGHIITPMVEQNFREQPELKARWEEESMLGRLAVPEEFKGVALFLCSQASSYMTGASLVVDGGHTAW